MNQPKFSQQPFKYVGGASSLDLVNTVDWTPNGPEHDRLGDYVRLIGWAEGAGVISERAGQRLKRMAGRWPDRAVQACRDGRRLRGVLKNLFDGVAAGRLLPETLAEFNQLLG